MRITVNVNVVASILLLAGEGRAEAAMLGNLTRLNRLVHETRNNRVEAFGQKNLNRVSARIILALCRNGKVEAQGALANHFRVVIESIDDEKGDVHIRAEE
jgi:hypothetical protein